jgi:hypothetical protein
MTGQLERMENRNGTKAGMTRKPERPESLNDRIDPCANILAKRLFIS